MCQGRGPRLFLQRVPSRLSAICETKGNRSTNVPGTWASPFSAACSFKIVCDL